MLVWINYQSGINRSLFVINPLLTSRDFKYENMFYWIRPSNYDLVGVKMKHLLYIFGLFGMLQIVIMIIHFDNKPLLLDNYYSIGTLFYRTYLNFLDVFGFIMVKLWCNNIWAASLEFSIPPPSPLESWNHVNLETNPEFQVEFVTWQTSGHIEQVSLIMFSSLFWLMSNGKKGSLRDVKRWCILQIASQ